jgi:uncharacterized protein (TIGR00725 family)
MGTVLSPWIAVLGGAACYDEGQIMAAHQVGREIARQGKNLVTGATTGIPYAAALGAKEGGALVVGISPAASPEEHVRKYWKPLDVFDFIVFTGVGAACRSSMLVQSAVGAIFLGGEFGTLNEFSAAWMCGDNVLGVLEGSGGITDTLRSTLARIETTWGSKVVFADDPADLTRRVCAEADAICSERRSRLGSNEVGADVREIIALTCRERGEEPTCTTDPEHTLTGALSLTARP